MADRSFEINEAGLNRAVQLLCEPLEPAGKLPDILPATGIGETAALELLAPIVLGGAQRLGTPTAFAHMDPPTPWVTWAASMWNASLNQNLLHPDVGPIARQLEEKVIDWLAPIFGMTGGHMTSGATLANLTALWAARDIAEVRTVIASEAAHMSVAKSAHILGLDCKTVPTDRFGRMDPNFLDSDLNEAVLVLTAGATSTGAIDPLNLAGRAVWTHVDAAWAGPMRLSGRLSDRLDGIDVADSVAISAHKWLFQPKEAALILFRDTDRAHVALSFGGAYLAAPNICILGSHGAAGVILLATLLAWGREGIAQRVENTFALSEELKGRLVRHNSVEVYPSNDSGVILWRPLHQYSVDAMIARFPKGLASKTRVHGLDWLRHVAANPNMDIEAVWSKMDHALAAISSTSGKY